VRLEKRKTEKHLAHLNNQIVPIISLPLHRPSNTRNSERQINQRVDRAIISCR